MILDVAVIAVLAAAALAGATAIGSRVIERRHPPGGTFVQVSGGRLHVVDVRPPAGADPDGPPVVLLHGASSSLEDMRMALGDRLARHHRLILVDRPGHGWSDRSGGSGAEPARQAGLIIQALDRLGVDKAIFVGHSWSGALVTALALAYPERTSGLILLAPVTHPWPGGVSWYCEAATTPLVGELLLRTLVMPVGALLLRSGADAVFAPQTAPRDYVERVVPAAGGIPRQCARSRRAQGFRDRAGTAVSRDHCARHDHHRRSRQDRFTGHPLAGSRPGVAAGKTDSAARSRSHAAPRRA
jgi:pimeloyl-ACP methyl ester carboxylesterase